jgi:VIT1/CCC1 family predicted Fe2+/Mn2+ transporter
MAFPLLRRRFEHHTEKVHARGGPRMRDLMLGLNDGLVATFALTAGIAGAFANPRLVIMAGLAEMLGGSVSMGLATFASARAQYEFYQSEIRREHDEIQRWPDRERDEIRAIYRNKGFSGPLLDQIVTHITADATRWRNVMMREELGFGSDIDEPPIFSGLTVGLAYLAGALVPVLPYALADPRYGVGASALTTVIVLFGAGAAKTIVTVRSWWRSGLESMAIGVVAAAVTFAAGLLFAHR